MPKVLKSGIFAPEYEIPEEVPAGLKAECLFCKAELETTKEEKGFKVDKKITRQGVLLIGWGTKCPECNRKVFFPYLDITSKTLAKINGYGK